MHLVFKDKLKFKDYFLFEEEESLKYIPNFNRINIIIGANNSGKSRFIREVIAADEFKLINLQNLISYNYVVREYNKFFRPHNIPLLSELNYDNLYSNVINANTNIVNNNIYVEVQRYRNLLAQRNINIHQDYSPRKKYFIPTLRTAHSLFQLESKNIDTSGVPNQYSKIANDIYKNTLEFYYNIDRKVDVFTGISLYKEILNTRNSEKKIRDRFSKFETFLSRHFFDGKSIDIVAKFDKDENEKGKNISEFILIHVDGETDTRKLYELGDGIQAIIILMYKIFMAEPDSIIFIDEPELNLHPGMQRLFLEQIYSNKELTDKNLIYLISTHSNHFLDLTIEKDDISIYAFSPKINVSGNKDFIIKNVNRGDNSILRDLGVKNSAVFLANCSIWVEGISDRNYLKAFLKAYVKNYKVQLLKEDIDYAFFEYAGSNIEHYIFDQEILDGEDTAVQDDINALALSNRIFLLADSDNAHDKSAKGERIKKLQSIKAPNFTFEVLQAAREIENLLPNSIWEKVLINFCNKKLIGGREDEVQSKINSTLTKIDSQNFSADYIGKFLNEINKKLKLDNKVILNKIFKSNQKLGTLKPKRELSELILEKVNNGEITWEHFQDNPEIERITKAVYEFITT